MHQHLLLKHLLSDGTALESLTVIDIVFAVCTLARHDVSKALSCVQASPLLLFFSCAFNDFLSHFDQIIPVVVDLI